MLVFLFSLSTSIIAEIDKTATTPLSTYDKSGVSKEWIDDLRSTQFKNQSYSPSSLEDTANDPNIFGNFRLGLSIFITAFAKATILLPLLFISFGVPSGLAILLSLPFWIVYFIGLIQLFGKFNFGGAR